MDFTTGPFLLSISVFMVSLWNRADHIFILWFLSIFYLLLLSFTTKAYIGNRKNMLSSNMSSRYPHNMVNFGPLTAEIGSGVWGTPVKFNGFRVLAALLHRSQVVSVSQTLRR